MASLQTVPKLALRVTRRAVDLAIGLAGSALDHLPGRGDGDAPPGRAPMPPTSRPTAPAASPRTPSTTPAASPPADLPRAAQPAPPPEPAPAPPEPDELVAESADPGAEGGAGPEIRVDEPWPGYAGMTAPAITDHLVACDAATVAAVELYEATHRKRRTVIDAARRQLARSG